MTRPNMTYVELMAFLEKLGHPERVLVSGHDFAKLCDIVQGLGYRADANIIWINGTQFIRPIDFKKPPLDKTEGLFDAT